MIFKEKFKMGLKDIDKNNLLKNRAILEYLENIGSYHSDVAGYGAEYTGKTGIAWVLLGWKLKVLKRPQYGQELEIHTWAKLSSKVATFRDFEIYDNNQNLCAIATSKWTMVDIRKGKITKIDDEVINAYKVESKNVFQKLELEKLKIPSNFDYKTEYTVKRKDIDINGHMHNLYYLDLAYEALPEEIYKKRPFDNVNIQYKKEIKLGEKVICKYAKVENKYNVTIFSEDEKNVHAIVELS